MADLAITNIEFSTSLTPRSIQLGENCVLSDVVYQHTDGKYYKADNLTSAKADAAFILLHAGSADNYVAAVPFSGDLVLTGPTLVQATQYVVSANAGKVAPLADLLSTAYKTYLFLGVDATTARCNLAVTELQVP